MLAWGYVQDSLNIPSELRNQLLQLKLPQALSKALECQCGWRKGKKKIPALLMSFPLLSLHWGGHIPVYAACNPVLGVCGVLQYVSGMKAHALRPPFTLPCQHSCLLFPLLLLLHTRLEAPSFIPHPFFSFIHSSFFFGCLQINGSRRVTAKAVRLNGANFDCMLTQGFGPNESFGPKTIF